LADGKRNLPWLMETFLGARDEPSVDLEAGTSTTPDRADSADERRAEGSKSDDGNVMLVGECHWYPDGETKEQCQARFKKNVEEQRQGYGNTEPFGKQSC
jgi:hypothetical protein